MVQERLWILWTYHILSLPVGFTLWWFQKGCMRIFISVLTWKGMCNILFTPAPKRSLSDSHKGGIRKAKDISKHFFCPNIAIWWFVDISWASLAPAKDDHYIVYIVNGNIVFDKKLRAHIIFGGIVSLDNFPFWIYLNVPSIGGRHRYRKLGSIQIAARRKRRKRRGVD